jgi:[ribosomal protein S5]-alanine N-acetyltransferase
MVPARNWVLRPVVDEDTDRLYALMCIPEVYRYLADGVVPPRAVLEYWIARSYTDFAAHNIGLWVLEDDHAVLAGCVRLEPQVGPRSAELTYVLHPQFWGLGLATRMSWTVMQHALQSSCVDQIVAGAEQPNTASIAVMCRLGMTFLRYVQYPAGPGVEYVFRCGDPSPAQSPQTIALRAARSS